MLVSTEIMVLCIFLLAVISIVASDMIARIQFLFFFNLSFLLIFSHSLSLFLPLLILPPLYLLYSHHHGLEVLEPHL